MCDCDFAKQYFSDSLSGDSAYTFLSNHLGLLEKYCLTYADKVVLEMSKDPRASGKITLSLMTGPKSYHPTNLTHQRKCMLMSALAVTRISVDDLIKCTRNSGLEVLANDVKFAVSDQSYSLQPPTPLEWGTPEFKNLSMSKVLNDLRVRDPVIKALYKSWKEVASQLKIYPNLRITSDFIEEIEIYNLNNPVRQAEAFISNISGRIIDIRQFAWAMYQAGCHDVAMNLAPEVFAGMTVAPAAASPSPMVISPAPVLTGYEYLMSQATAEVGKSKEVIINLIDNKEAAIRALPLFRNVEGLVCSGRKKLSEHLSQNPWLAKAIQLAFSMLSDKVYIIKEVQYDQFARIALQDIYDYAPMKGLLGAKDDQALLNALISNMNLRIKAAKLVPASHAPTQTLMENPGFIIDWSNRIRSDSGETGTPVSVPGKKGYGDRRQSLLKCVSEFVSGLDAGGLNSAQFFIKDEVELQLLWLQLRAPTNTWEVKKNNDNWIEAYVEQIGLSHDTKVALIDFIRSNEYSQDLLDTITNQDLTDAGITAKGIQAKILKHFNSKK